MARDNTPEALVAAVLRGETDDRARLLNPVL